MRPAKVLNHKTLRRLRRFFSAVPIPAVGQPLFLTDSETRHLRDILRLHEGDRCFVTDGSGHEAEALIVHLPVQGKAKLIIEKIKSPKTSGRTLNLSVFVALPQKGKMDYMVEKAQELGVKELHPLETERTVVKMSEENKSKTRTRWEKIAREAAKQSGVLETVKIFPPVAFERAVEFPAPQDLAAIFHPAEDALSFPEWIQTLQKQMSRGSKNAGENFKTVLFFGPEGGFSEREIEVACSKKIQKVGLGSTILKIDTAFLSVVAALRLLYS